MSRLSKPTRSTALLATLAGGLMLAAAPALADDDDHRRHRHHHHYGHGGKQVFYDGPCKVERKWYGHGGYKEEVKCRPAQAHYHSPHYPAPVVAYYPPPPPPPVYVGPPTISVVIPIGR